MSNASLKRSSRAGAVFAGALLALGVIFAPGGAALAAEIENGDPVYIGGREGYSGTGIFPIWSSGSQAGEPDYWAYCIEHDVSAKTGLQGTVGDVDSFLGSNYFADPAIPGKVLWVLAHSYPAVSLEELAAEAGVPVISRSDAIEATQYAIWRYTDLNFDAAWAWETPESEAAYWYLVNGANASPGLTPGELTVTTSVTAPSAAQVAGTLVGPFVVNTNQATVALSVDPVVTVTDVDGNAIDVNTVADGQEIYLDLRGTTTAGSATVRVVADGATTGKVVSVPNTPGGTPSEADHAQTIILVAPGSATTTAEATVAWAAAPGAVVPAIGTSLVDSADGDQVLAWNGGTVIDTVAYENLVPGTEYTLVGELMRKADGSSTGITGTTTFTPTSANGSVDVRFVVPEGFAGQTLVAFEWLFVGTDTLGEPVAAHTDIEDAAQTVVVDTTVPVAPVVPAAPSPSGGQHLAATGSPAPVALAAGALLSVLAGVALMIARRRSAEA